MALTPISVSVICPVGVGCFFVSPHPRVDGFRCVLGFSWHLSLKDPFCSCWSLWLDAEASLCCLSSPAR